MKYFFLLYILFIISCRKSEPNSLKLSIAETKSFSIAKKFYENGKADSAFKYFNQASSYYLLNKDSIQYANSLAYLAIISIGQGDYYGSEEINTTAIKYLKQPRDNKFLLPIYNSIAMSRKNLRDYKTAIIWYNKSLDIAEDLENSITIKNNIAIANAKMKNFTEAINILENLISESKKIQNNKIKSKIIDNLAFTRFLQNPSYPAEKELHEALEIRIQNSDIWGQNASQAHLSSYFYKKNKKKSLFHANKMYQIAGHLNSPDDRLEALENLILSEDFDKSKKYFQKYKNLDDSLKTARSKAKNQFALIRYETEKNKADFLRSQAKNAEKEIEIIQRNIGLGILSLLLISTIFWYKRRKKRLEKENYLKIKENQLKISKKVHDVVANGIYHVMTKIENQEHFDKTKALDELEFVYEKSRDISYEKPRLDELKKDFSKKVSTLIASFKNETVNTYTVGNAKEIWSGLTESTEDEIYHIIRELLVNMKKHSQADKVIFKFERINDQIHIQYTDNGIGISGDIIRNNGLKNTDSRIENIHGAIIFDTKTEKGLKASISFPVS